MVKFKYSCCVFLLRFSGMGIIQAVKEKIVGELHEKLVKRMEFEKGRDVTERENQQVCNIINDRK